MKQPSSPMRCEEKSSGELIRSDVTTITNEKIRLAEINAYLTCHLCKGYLIDATTISECLHSFCRSCIIKFLGKNSSCPVCDVMINKAKPCLKLDKTKQDVVYKLVPGLFVNEMQRRKEFYQNRPALAPKVSPEERGEDTERTIFNPTDAISLSLEYVSDDSSPGAIPTLLNNNNNNIGEMFSHDNPMKRYLQCPGMCRIEVLKKFVRNKYNVDTNLFHIDILYKRVPLPDHYTLIDIGYIYSWKRNEPMKFFFRITDLNTVRDRFDYFDGRLSPVVNNFPNKLQKQQQQNVVDVDKNNDTCKVSNVTQIRAEKRERRNKKQKRKKVTTAVTKDKCTRKSIEDKSTEDAANHTVNDDLNARLKTPPPLLLPQIVKHEHNNRIQQLKREIRENITGNFHNGTNNNQEKNVYTNITLNRDDNLEIITKIHKVSNKEGQHVGVNIINHTIKKTQENGTKPVKSVEDVEQSTGVEVSKETPKTPKESKEERAKTNPKEPTSDKQREEEEEVADVEKSNFLKSIHLTPKNSQTPSPQQKKLKNPSISPPVLTDQRNIATTTPTSTCEVLKKQQHQKRKNVSPTKLESATKRAKNGANNDPQHLNTAKKPMKIIIQPKKPYQTMQQPSQNPVKNVPNAAKAACQTNATDIQTLINNCKLNIPSSLSITVNEGIEGSVRPTPPMPPVKNFIEILKIPDNLSLSEELNNNRNTPGSMVAKEKPSSFQKIFEEAVIGNNLPLSGNTNTKKKLKEAKTTEAQKRKQSDQALDVTCNKQQKKVDSVERVSSTSSPPAPLLSPVIDDKTPELGMRSLSLGLNYTVSVDQSSLLKERGLLSGASSKRSLMVSLPITVNETQINEILAQSSKNNNNSNHSNGNHNSGNHNNGNHNSGNYNNGNHSNGNHNNSNVKSSNNNNSNNNNLNNMLQEFKITSLPELSAQIAAAAAAHTKKTAASKTNGGSCTIAAPSSAAAPLLRNQFANNNNNFQQSMFLKEFHQKWSYLGGAAAAARQHCELFDQYRHSFAQYNKLWEDKSVQLQNNLKEHK